MRCEINIEYNPRFLRSCKEYSFTSKKKVLKKKSVDDARNYLICHLLLILFLIDYFLWYRIFRHCAVPVNGGALQRPYVRHAFLRMISQKRRNWWTTNGKTKARTEPSSSRTTQSEVLITKGGLGILGYGYGIFWSAEIAPSIFGQCDSIVKGETYGRWVRGMTGP